MDTQDGQINDKYVQLGERASFTHGGLVLYLKNGFDSEHFKLCFGYFICFVKKYKYRIICFLPKT